jgi:hypothetical protein
MVEVKTKEAREFLGGITSEDSVAIIHDIDPDGFTSGVLFYNYCKKVGAKIGHFGFSRSSSSVEDFDLAKFTTIITTDIDAGHLLPILEKYKDKRILFMDHHPKNAEFPSSVFEYRTMYRGYIPSARSAYEITGGKYWLGLTGCIGDAGERYPENDEFIKKGLALVGMPLGEFKDKIVWKISNMIAYFEKRHDKTFSILQSLKGPENVHSIEKYSEPIEEEISKFKGLFESEKEDLGGITYFYFEPKYPVKGAITGISMRPENIEKIFLFATPKSNAGVGISARSQTRRIDMAKLLKIGIGDMQGESGGHFAASGATIRAKDLEQFKENIRTYAEENL